MERKRIALAGLILFGVALAWNALLHLVLLAKVNALVLHLRRPNQPWVIPTSLLLTAGIVTLFLLGYLRFSRRPTLREGLTYGLSFGLLAGLLVDLNQFLLYPIPAKVAACWFAGGLLEFSFYGILLAKIIPPKGPMPESMRSKGPSHRAVPTR
ncbi:hypothetical protein [Geothrix sp. 21YS21S-2]|uniref:hypothetical protein n=1 Tax=Geothrix sp. 21YS21S-2 TaxID=3068893 RepID=UPI0027BA8FFB|nr:hypothetical protein [Geothrix sp. 21YS21S-2]